MEKIQDLVRYFFILEPPCSQQFPSDIRFFDSNIMLSQDHYNSLSQFIKVFLNALLGMEICLSMLCNFIFLKGSVRHNNYILNCMECERSLFYHDYSCFLLRQSFLSIFLYLRVFRSNTPLNSTFKNHRQYHITDISIKSGDIFNLRSYKSILTCLFSQK